MRLMGSMMASRTSSVFASMILGIPEIRSGLYVHLADLVIRKAEPMVVLMISPDRSPISRLYFRFRY
jgi:hypothetical protein